MPARRILLVRLGSPPPKGVWHPRGVHLPFHLKYLQAILLRGSYTVGLIDCPALGIGPLELLRRSEEWHPDILVVSLTPLEREPLREYASRLKRRRPVQIIAIGPDVSFDPDTYLRGEQPIDLAIPGEAEVECARLIDQLSRGVPLEELQAFTAKLLSERRPLLIEDPDRLPFPVYGPRELERYLFLDPMPVARRAVWGHLLASRGCPYPCLFCNQMTRATYGRQVRLRDPRRVAQEISYLAGRGATLISFNDDNLTTNRSFLLALCRELVDRGNAIPWAALGRADNITPPLAQAMHRAGCRLLRLGIESAAPRIVRLLRKGADGSAWSHLVQQAVETARAAGIPTLGFFIIGNPTETEEEILQTIRFALELPLDFAQVHFFTPYLGTEAYGAFRERIDPSEAPRQHHYDTPRVNLSAVETRRLSDLRALFYRRFYGRPGWIARHLKRYGPFYACNPTVLRSLLAGAGLFR